MKSPEQIGAEAALGLLPTDDANWAAGFALRGTLQHLEGKPTYIPAIGAGLDVLSGAADADSFRSRFRLMDSPMMQAQVLDSARRCFASLSAFARAGFAKQWPQFKQ